MTTPSKRIVPEVSSPMMNANVWSAWKIISFVICSVGDGDEMVMGSFTLAESISELVIFLL